MRAVDAGSVKGILRRIDRSLARQVPGAVDHRRDFAGPGRLDPEVRCVRTALARTRKAKTPMG